MSDKEIIGYSQEHRPLDASYYVPISYSTHFQRKKEEWDSFIGWLEDNHYKKEFHHPFSGGFEARWTRKRNDRYGEIEDVICFGGGSGEDGFSIYMRMDSSDFMKYLIDKRF